MYSSLLLLHHSQLKSCHHVEKDREKNLRFLITYYQESKKKFQSTMSMAVEVCGYGGMTHTCFCPIAFRRQCSRVSELYYWP